MMREMGIGWRFIYLYFPISIPIVIAEGVWRASYLQSTRELDMCILDIVLVIRLL
jgi:hypothetical protein